MRRTTPLTVTGLLGLALLLPTTSADAAGETCRGEAATIVGTERTLVGTEGRDVIVTGAATDVDALGGDDPLASMHRTHREVQLLGNLLSRLAAGVPPDGPDPAAVTDVRRVLYGLDAILRLHFAQENELYYGMASAGRGGGRQGEAGAAPRG